MKKSNQNHGRRNIVFAGFTDRELEKLEFQDIRTKKENWKNTDLTHRFPRLVYLDTAKQARRHQGLILFIKMNNEALDFVEYDINNRKQFRNYEYVYLVVENKSKECYLYQVVNIAHILNKYSKIAVINFHNLVYQVGINATLKRMYEYYLENCKKTVSRIKLENIEKFKLYVTGKKYIDIKKAAIELSVSTKWIERYLSDMNDIYHNVGYDEVKKQFYIVK